MNLIEMKKHCYDLVVAGLAKQEWKQSKDGDKCVWFGQDDCRCAIGHLLDDRARLCDVHPWLTVAIDMSLFRPEISTFMEQKVNRAQLSPFLRELQYAHDGGGELQSSFLRIGTNHGLIP